MTLWLLLAACQLHPAEPISASGARPRLVIAHTNDLHAHFAPSQAAWLPGSPDIGGFAAIAGHVEKLHEDRGADNVLVLDGGDIMTGTPLMEFEVRGVRGGAMLDFMEGAGMDAWVLGNHEFDIGYEHVSGLVAASRMPVLSANLDAIDGSGAPAIPGVRDHAIFERAGLRVGVFGLTTDGLARLTGTDATEQMLVRSPVEVAAEQVALLEPKVDLVVALTHIGLAQDRVIAAEVDGIDLIVGGHSHTSLTEPVQVNGTWIVQAGNYGRQIGVMEMSVTNGRIVEFEGGLLDLAPGATQPSDAAAALMREWSERIDALFAEPVGRVVGGSLTRSKRTETTLGRWAADMVRESAGTDIGIYNPGGLRSNLQEGEVTRRELYRVFPFANDVVRFSLTGTEILGLVLKNAVAEITGTNSVMQLSGITASWRVVSGVPSLDTVLVAGKPVVPGARYTAATNSYVADRWKHNLGFEPTELTSTGVTVFDASVERARSGPIIPPREPRMVRIDH